MSKVARRVAEELLYPLDTQCIKQLGDGDTAHRIDGINGHGEVGLADGLNINEVECQHMVDVAAQPGVVLLFTAQVVHIGIIKILGLGQPQDFLALGIGEEFTIVIEELERIPLLGIVRCGDDDTAAGLFAHHGQLGRGSGGQTDVHDIKAHARECTHHRIEYHAS